MVPLSYRRPVHDQPMTRNSSPPRSTAAPRRSVPRTPETLSNLLLHHANKGLPRAEFLELTLSLLAELAGCDLVEMRFTEREHPVRCHIHRTGGGFAVVYGEPGKAIAGSTSIDHRSWDDLASAVARGQAGGHGTPGGSRWLIGLTPPLATPVGLGARAAAFIPIRLGIETIGVLALADACPTAVRPGEAPAWENLGRSLGVALVNQDAQSALRERIKELDCLYRVSQVAAEPHLSPDEMLAAIVAALPPGWQYPEITAARLVLDDLVVASPGFRDDLPTQRCDILVQGRERGLVEVGYREPRPELHEGPFLREERNLLNAVAHHLGLVIERREAAVQRSQLEEQLRHADRLATLGQLSAGVAHELNEPLANILGFAQLIGRHPGLPSQCRSDLERIVAASLHAREVVRKLQLFARQKAPTVALVDLNRLVQDGMYFLESRCARQGVELARNLDPNQPQLRADPSQVQQVLVNLVVNALQAMPDGGRLTIQTECGAGTARLVVMDTGVGMDQETQRQMFVPFFTTKDVDQGTGLGLAVVHGIVTSHGGTITVTSDLGSGSRFCVELPSAGHAGEGA